MRPAKLAHTVSNLECKTDGNGTKLYLVLGSVDCETYGLYVCDEYRYYRYINCHNQNTVAMIINYIYIHLST